MNRLLPVWPDQAERERRAARARRATLGLALVAAILLWCSAWMSGCGPKRLGPKEMYLDPIGAEYIDGYWYCVDSRGTKWLSNGECD